MTIPRYTVWGVPGLPEISEGDDLLTMVVQAIEAMAATDRQARLCNGDILVVSSKVVSKAEGRQFPAVDREQVITEETVRVVAERIHPGGVTRIVETRHGLVMAAAGVDMSNVPDGQALRLPEDPDRSARALCNGLRQHFDVSLGLVITDTMGRTWRVGQTDVAIGAAGLTITEDLRGGSDANGRPLNVTLTALADEIAGAADLVKGKASRIPVAILRGLGQLVADLDAPGARSLVRPVDDDMFRLGSIEAYRLGYAAAIAEMRAAEKSLPKKHSQEQTICE